MDWLLTIVDIIIHIYIVLYSNSQTRQWDLHITDTSIDFVLVKLSLFIDEICLKISIVYFVGLYLVNAKLCQSI